MSLTLSENIYINNIYKTLQQTLQQKMLKL